MTRAVSEDFLFWHHSFLCARSRNPAWVVSLLVMDSALSLSLPASLALPLSYDVFISMSEPRFIVMKIIIVIIRSSINIISVIVITAAPHHFIATVNVFVKV